MKSIPTFILQITLAIFLTAQLSAQTNTWIGGDDTWDISSNWSLLHVPLSTEDVSIPAGSNVTIVTTPASNALTITIEANASLSLKTGTNLRLIGSGATDSRIKNFGTFINQGTIIISNSGTGNICVENSGSSAQFINEGLLDINGYQGAGIHGIRNLSGADFNNISGGTITINDGHNTSSGSAIDNTSTGTDFENEGQITITNVRNGITNTGNAVFTNESVLTLNDIKWDAGIENGSGATFQNLGSGYITLETLNSVGGIEAIYNSAIFINESDIEIISPSGEGVENRGSTAVFNNTGAIDMSGVAAANGLINSSNATWIGDGSISTGKSIFQNWIYSPQGPTSVVNITGHLNLISNAKDTLRINGTNQGGASNGFDVLDINGDLTMGGKLIIKTENGYVPEIYDQFTLFQYTGTLSGSFSSLELPVGYEGFTIDISTAGKVILNNVNCNLGTNTFTGPLGGKWLSPVNWSLGHTPKICETVVINAGDSVNIINPVGSVYNLEVRGSIHIATSGSLTVDGYGNVRTGINMIDGIIFNEGTLNIQNFNGTPGNGPAGIQLSNGSFINSGTLEIENIIFDGPNPVFSTAFYLSTPSTSLQNLTSGIIRIRNINVTGLRTQGTVENNGIIEVSNSNEGNGIWTFNHFKNTSTGTIEITNILDGAGLSINSNTFENEGNIIINSTDNVGVRASPNGHLKNNGTIDVSNTSFPNISIGLNQKVSGSGIYNLDGVLSVGGQCVPGNSVGKIVVNGGFTQNINSVDTFEIFGTAGGGLVGGHDQIEVNGNLTRGGKIVVDLKDGFVPLDNARFVLFKYTNALLGSFNEFELPPAISDWVIDDATMGEISLQKVSCSRDTNIWVGGSLGKWHLNSNWSKGHIPKFCENVLINGPDSVEITSGNAVAYIHGIEINTGASLKIESNASIHIDPKSELFMTSLSNKGVVNNEGTIICRNANRAKSILTQSGGIITNAGIIDIGDYEGPNAIGLSCTFSSTFINQLGATIHIENASVNASSGLSVVTGSQFDNYGQIDLLKAGALVTLSSGTVFNNYGTITCDSLRSLRGIGVDVSSVFQNHSGGQININNMFTSSLAANGINVKSEEGLFINDGNIDISTIANHGVFCEDATLINNGTIGVSNVALLNAEGKDIFVDGGKYKGVGEAYGTTEIVFGGLLSPGNSPGYVYFEGDVTLADNNLDTFEIGGTASNQFDQLEVLDGDLTIGGLMIITLIDGFVPDDNDVFEIMRYNQNFNGSFFLVVLPVALTGWELDYSVQGRVRLLKPACTPSNNIWTGTGPVFGVWSDASKWSLGHSPRYCEDVIIQSTGKVVIEDLTFAAAHSIDINGGMLNVNPIGFLNIDVSGDNKTGLTNRNGGTFTNFGDVFIFDTNGSNADGVYNDGTFENGNGSELNIFNITGGLAEGFTNLGTVTNNGDINIYDIIQSNGVQTSLNGSSFENNGNITIRGIDNWGLTILSNSVFTQTENGTLSIEDCGSFGIRMNNNAFLELDGSVIIKQ